MSPLVESIVNFLSRLTWALDLLTPAAGLVVAVVLPALLVMREALSPYHSPLARAIKLAVTIVILPLGAASAPIVAFRLASLLR